jgi:hypothetical protein
MGLDWIGMVLASYNTERRRAASRGADWRVWEWIGRDGQGAVMALYNTERMGSDGTGGDRKGAERRGMVWPHTKRSGGHRSGGERIGM